MSESRETSTAPVRILVVDDHALVREGLHARLSRVEEFEIVGEAASAEQALVLLRELTPDLALVDIGMKHGSGIELTRVVAERYPAVAVLILSMYDNPEYVREAMEAGARGYVLKDGPSAQIVHAIKAVAGGGTYLSPTIAGALFGPRTVEKALTVREQQVLALLAKGHPSKLIAKTMNISVRTVEAHRQSIKRKLEIDGQAELIKFAVERFKR
jgi:DNA-binding NarL/FixJ family response regulator